MPRSPFRPQVERLDELCLPSFLAPVSYAANASYPAVADADFNNDGRPDLVVAIDTYPPSVGVLLGNADGTFRPPVSSAAGSNRPGSLAVGDFDGDGKLDLVTVGGSSTVGLLRGNGDGTFAPPASVVVVGQPMSVAVGDFNGDGLLDLGVTSVFVSYGPYDTYTDGFATLLLGDGAGGLTPSSTTGLGSGYPVRPPPATSTAITGSTSRASRPPTTPTGSPRSGCCSATATATSGRGPATTPMTASPLSPRGTWTATATPTWRWPFYQGVSVLRNDGAGGFGPAQFSATGYNPAFIAARRLQPRRPSRCRGVRLRRQHRRSSAWVTAPSPRRSRRAPRLPGR